jgi:hypothetical protein
LKITSVLCIVLTGSIKPGLDVCAVILSIVKLHFVLS